MKYLKKYNESVDTEEVINTIKDICIELEDEGFSIEIQKHLDSGTPTGGTTTLYIKKYFKQAEWHSSANAGKGGECSFSFGVVREVVERLSDYLGENVRHVEYMVRRFNFPDEWIEIPKWFIKNKPGVTVYCVRINFVNGKNNWNSRTLNESVIQNPSVRFNQKILNSIEEIKAEYKSEIDECLNYLTDEFPSQSVCVVADTIEINSKRNRLSVQYVISIKRGDDLPTKLGRISKFEEACECVIERLEEINAEYKIHLEYHWENASMWAPIRYNENLDTIVDHIKNFDMREANVRRMYDYVKITITVK